VELGGVGGELPPPTAGEAAPTPPSTTFVELGGVGGSWDTKIIRIIFVGLGRNP